MRRGILITLICCCLSMVFFTLAQASDVTLAWDPNDPAPDGYRLFMRQDGQVYDYSSPAWQGTDTQATLSDLSEGVTYAFVCRAFVGDQESGDSNEVVYTIEAPPASVVIPKRPATLIIKFE